MTPLAGISDEAGIKASYRGETVAGEYVELRFTSELQRLLHDRQVAAIQRTIDREKPKRILEIAPGPGRITRAIRPSGALVCLEYNEGMIGEGRAATNGKANWVRGDGFRLPFGPAFDLVYSFRFVRHFQLADRRRLYEQIRNVLNPGGCFIMDAVNEAVSRPLRLAHPGEFPIYDELYDRDRLRKELHEAGLEVEELVSVQKWYRWQFRSQVFLGPRAGWLNRLIVRGLERLPRRDGLEWIVICRRV